MNLNSPAPIVFDTNALISATFLPHLGDEVFQKSGAIERLIDGRIGNRHKRPFSFEDLLRF
ncbi:hypothetical protein [Candidatus Glomeribacter gigasporarum]|uniref:hypothetical protein n=1 Tax=Candidatus Glomeribacter gigasporarum TaxID=132144 RepID=UPI0003104946|nr:hypothetical protein [Candidatus Glomeribacter gigasporarum]